jgi:hypothetical protein
MATVSATAQQGMAPFQIAETGRTYSRLADAVEAVGEGQATIIIAPGTYRECAVQSAGHISFKAEAPGRSIFDGGICEGKAALVLRGQSAAIDGLVFQNMAVPDGNGAGIRLEKGNLAVTRSVFRNSEQGLLTAQDPAGEIVIDQTTFQRTGPLRPRAILRAQHLYRRFRFADRHPQPLRTRQWRALCQKPRRARDHPEQRL